MELEKNDFKPITAQETITGTSYKLQFGTVKDIWASKLLKGSNVIATNTYKDVEGEFPNLNLIVQWVLRSIVIININPHQVMKTSENLIEQALEEMKKKALSKDIAEKIVNQKKIQSLLKVKIIRLNIKIDFLKKLENLIKNNATGHDIQEELGKYPRYYTDIFRTYDSTFIRVGDTSFKEYLINEKAKESKFKRLDSCENFMKLLRSTLEYTQTDIDGLKSELNKLA